MYLWNKLVIIQWDGAGSGPGSLTADLMGNLRCQLIYLPDEIQYNILVMSCCRKRPGSLTTDLMSDHIFLGASLVAILTAEGHQLAAYARSWQRRGVTEGAPSPGVTLHRRLVIAAMVAWTLLLSAICTDMWVSQMCTDRLTDKVTDTLIDRLTDRHSGVGASQLNCNQGESF